MKYLQMLTIVMMHSLLLPSIAEVQNTSRLSRLIEVLKALKKVAPNVGLPVPPMPKQQRIEPLLSSRSAQAQYADALAMPPSSIKPS